MGAEKTTVRVLAPCYVGDVHYEAGEHEVDGNVAKALIASGHAVRIRKKNQKKKEGDKK